MRSMDKRHVDVLEFLNGKDSMEEGDDEYTGIESIGILICRSIIKQSGGEILVKMHDN